MAEIRIAQLCAAPTDLWRFHATTNSHLEGDAVVYISRVLALGLVDDEHNVEHGTEQRFAAIDADDMRLGVEDYHCVGSGSGWSTEVVHAGRLEDALDLAEKWWRQVCQQALAGHDITARVHRSGMNMWELHAGPCAPECPRCTVEKAASRAEQPVVLEERYLRALHLEHLVAVLIRHGVAVPDSVDARSRTAILNWACSEFGLKEAEDE